MCLAIPGKIIKIQGRQAYVQYPGQVNRALIGNDPVKVGDYVLVQMGIVISRLSKKESESSLKAWQQST